MNRRDFFKWLGGGVAGAVVAGAVDPFDIDYEKALWLPGQKTIFDLGAIIQPDAQTIDKVLAAHGVRMPRYHLTVAGRGTFFFDEHWRLLSGREIQRDGSKMSVGPADIARLEREMLGSFPPPLGLVPRKQRWETLPRDIVSRGGEEPMRVVVNDEVKAALGEAQAQLKEAQDVRNPWNA